MCPPHAVWEVAWQVQQQTQGAIDLISDIRAVSYQAIAHNLSEPQFITSKMVRINLPHSIIVNEIVELRSMRISWVPGRCSVFAVTTVNVLVMSLYSSVESVELFVHAT
jgi:hypothetical protein